MDVCHDIFDIYFFHDSNPSGPLINSLKYLLFQFRFRRDIQIFKKLSGLHHTAESDSAGGEPKLRCVSMHLQHSVRTLYL